MKLTITRDTGWYAMLRKLKVLVDGEVIGTIGRNETRTFDVLRGVHEVSAKIDWVETNRLSLDFDTGDKKVVIGSHRTMRELFLTNRRNLIMGKTDAGESLISLTEQCDR